MIKCDDFVTVIEGDQAVVGAELAAVMHIFREKYGEEEFEEVLRISKMGPEESLAEMLRVMADMISGRGEEE